MKGNDMDKMTTILQGLINRTEDGNLKWRTTLNDNVFVSAVNTTGVVIKLLPAGSVFDSERHRLEILNDDGMTAVVLETEGSRRLVPKENRATEEQVKDLRRLFALARHSALNADLTLDKLARDLERIR